MFLTRCLRSRLLREFVVRRLERGLELPYVLGLQEQAERGAEVGRPGVRGHNAVRQRAGQTVRPPLLQRPLEVGPVQLRVRVLPRGNGALHRIEGVLRPLAAEEAEPLDRGRTMRRTLRQREAVREPV